MFTRIPMGKPEWNERAQRYILCFYPLVGIVVGAITAAWFWLATDIALPNTLRALGLTLIPLAVTGGIHLDGLADTCDALASNAEPERRRAILKDPHAGAFAVIGVVVYLLSYFALTLTLTQLPVGGLPVAIYVGLSHVFSRSGVAATMVLAKPSGEGLGMSFHDSASRATAPIMVAVAVIAVAGAVVLSAGNIVLAAAILMPLLVSAIVHTFAILTAHRKFGGYSGDLAGYQLCLAEIAYLATLVLLFATLFGR
jgi:adenosylcobinamide-GDP ribazoletransferase